MPQQPESFPRQFARTRGFRLGAPRGFTVTPDGRRVLFLRSEAGDDPVNRLWCLDLDGETPVERLVVDPLTLLGDRGEDLPPEERARRERMRETTSGITSYAIDRDGAVATFALSGRLFVADVAAAVTQELDVPCPVVDPRPDPTGGNVAFVAGRGLHVVETGGGACRPLLLPESGTVAYGLADFVAAEELDRVRGHWWAPDGSALLVERYDEAPVARWWIADPAEPARAPQEHRYPAAGCANPLVSLHLASLDGRTVAVGWDHDAFPYLVAVRWSGSGRPLVTVLSRDQRRMQVLDVDTASGGTSVAREIEDACWVDVVPGSPARAPDGRLVHTVDDAATDTRRLAFDGEPVTPPGWQVRRIVDVGDRGVLLLGSHEPVELHVARVSWDGTMTPLTGGGGHHTAVAGGSTTVVVSNHLDSTTTQVAVHHASGSVDVGSRAETPLLTPRVELLRAGQREVRTAVLFPTGHVPGSRRLPVLMAPYGGPHHLEVLAAGTAFCEAQWFADQGCCVVVADGRGTPGRGPAWERGIHLDLVAVLDDQVAALDAVAAAYPDDVDTDRVGIRGWSFGGWLAALAVLRRPDVFHVAVAGAPVTDWHRYDTAYTERYLGMPGTAPEVYERNSLLADAATLRRPLLLVHGLADDNVVAAHTLVLSGALLAAGRPHNVLPLTGVTHMTPQEVVAENLLRLQAGFLLEHLT